MLVFTQKPLVYAKNAMVLSEDTRFPAKTTLFFTPIHLWLWCCLSKQPLFTKPRAARAVRLWGYSAFG